MRLRTIRDILEAEVLVGEEHLEMEVHTAKASDLMSDVLALSQPGAVLLTGLAYAQVIRTAEVADIHAVIFVRGRRPSADVIALAAERGIPLLTTQQSMFVASGRLFERGLFGPPEAEPRTIGRDARLSLAGVEAEPGEYVHSFRIDQGKCIGCVACMRACPTRAIRVRDGKAQAAGERCVDCGACMRACPKGAIVPLTTSLSDLGKFRYTVALPSPVLYGQFRKGTRPGQILSMVV